MILYHQTSEVFDRFDLSKARPGAFGAGAYFYVEKLTEADAHGIVCDVQLSNPMKEGEKVVADEKWDEMSRVVERLVLRDGDGAIHIPHLGCSDVRNFRLLCYTYAGNMEHPNWPEFLSEFRRVTGCDGYVVHDFVMCFDADEISIVGRF